VPLTTVEQHRHEIGATAASVLLERIADHIRQLNGQGVTFLLVEHNMGFVMNLCHEVVVLHQGRVIAQGKPPEVRENPAVLDAYLGA